jgi:hypothetical protein
MALTLTIPYMLHAQRNPGGGMRQRPPEEMAKAQTARMKEGLSLTTEQEKTVYQTNLRFANRISAARKEAEAAGGRPDMDSIRNWSRQRDEALRSTLTEEQYGKMLRQREELRRQVPGDGRLRNGGGLR